MERSDEERLVGKGVRARALFVGHADEHRSVNISKSMSGRVPGLAAQLYEVSPTVALRS
jgi:hypothetical protein